MKKICKKDYWSFAFLKDKSEIKNFSLNRVNDNLRLVILNL